MIGRLFGRKVIWETEYLKEILFGRKNIWETEYLKEILFGRKNIWETEYLKEILFGSIWESIREKSIRTLHGFLYLLPVRYSRK